MRRIPPRHNLARLRLFLNLRQKQMAEICDCSVDTIQSIELGRGRLALSESLARKISNNTRIAAEWLLENDLKAHLIGDDNKPFTMEHYNERRSLRDLGLPTPRGMAVTLEGGGATTIIFYAWMRAIFETKDGDIALWQTGKFLEKLADKYGHNSRVISGPLKIAALRDHQVRFRQAEIGMRLAEKYARRSRKGKLRPGNQGGLQVPLSITRGGRKSQRR